MPAVHLLQCGFHFVFEACTSAGLHRGDLRLDGDIRASAH